MNILDEYGIEVATQSISNPENTCYVVISRETVLENLQESEQEVTTRSEETWAALGMEETRAGSLRLFTNKASLNARRTIRTYEKKWITIHAHSRHGGVLAVTKMSHHFDQEERESDGSRHWHSIQSGKERNFAREGARDFSDEAWLQRFLKDALVVFQIVPELMVCVFIPRVWKRDILHRGFSWNYQSILGYELIQVGKEKDKDRPAVFLTPTNPFGNDPEETS